MMIMMEASERLKKKKKKKKKYLKCHQPGQRKAPQTPHFAFTVWQFKKKNETASKKENNPRNLDSVFFLFCFNIYRIWKTWKLTSF